MNILICDDQPILRQGVRRLLENSNTSFNLDEAGSASEAMKLLHENTYQIMILDISMSRQDGISMLRDIKAVQPLLPVLMLSVYTEKNMVLGALKNGASGYLSKNFVFEELMLAINSILGGKQYVETTLKQILMDDMINQDKDLLHYELTSKELNIMLKLVSGKRICDIATELNKSPSTISSYKGRILETMKMKSISELVKYCVEHNLS